MFIRYYYYYSSIQQFLKISINNNGIKLCELYS